MPALESNYFLVACRARTKLDRWYRGLVDRLLYRTLDSISMCFSIGEIETKNIIYYYISL